MAKKNEYFINYYFKSKIGEGEGTTNIIMKNKITSMEVIEKLQKEMAEKFNVDYVIIKNWKCFEKK